MKQLLIILFFATIASAGTGYTVTRNDESPFFEFIQLYDTPESYSASGGLVVTVNAGATALEFTSLPSHVHDGDTLELDGIDSDGGAFSFNTTGDVTFNQSIEAAGYTITTSSGGFLELETSSDGLELELSSDTLGLELSAAIHQILYLNGTSDLTYESGFEYDPSTDILTVDALLLPGSGGIIISSTVAIGLDMIAGTFATAIQKWPAGTIQSTGDIVFQPTSDGTTRYQWLNAAGDATVLIINTVNERVSIGTDDAEGTLHVKGPSFPLFFIERTTSVTNAARTTGIFKHTTSGNMVDGFGVALEFFVEDVTSSSRSLGQLAVVRDGDDGSGEIQLIPRSVGALQFGTFIIKSDRKIGFNEPDPETLLELTHAQPYITLHCDTHSDGSRKSNIFFKGEKANTTEHFLAAISVDHDGTGNNVFGKMVIGVNTGAGVVDVIEIDSSANTKIGDAGVTDYTQIADDGELTLHGTARVLRSVDFEPEAVKQGGVGPGASTEDSFPIHDFSAVNDESVFIHWEIPHEYASAGEIHMHAEYFVDTAPVGAETVTWGIEYKKISIGENFDFSSGTTTVIVNDTLTTGTPANDKQIHSSPEIHLTTTGFEPMDVVLIRFFRDADASEGGATDDFGSDARLFNYHLMYLSDKMGQGT